MDEALDHLLLPGGLGPAAGQSSMVSPAQLRYCQPRACCHRHARTWFCLIMPVAALLCMCDVTHRHGGTPNLSQYTRAIPSARYTLQSPAEKAATIGPIGDGGKIPWETWQRMTEQGQHICRHIVAEPGVRRHNLCSLRSHKLWSPACR